MRFKLDRFGCLWGSDGEHPQGEWLQKVCPFSSDEISCGNWCALFERRGRTVRLHCARVQYSLDYVETAEQEAAPATSLDKRQSRTAPATAKV